MAKYGHALFAFMMVVCGLFPADGIAADYRSDPCSLLAPAEIQAVVGKPVKPGTPKVNSNPLAGAGCTYVVGDSGSLNILAKPLQRGENAASIKAQFVKMKMIPTDAPGIGEAAFFTSPGYTMVQLHAFKAGRYVLVTLLVPGCDETAVRPMAAKLMKKALERIH